MFFEVYKVFYVKKLYEKKVLYYKRDVGWVEGVLGFFSYEGKVCMGEGCIYDVMVFNVVGDGIMDDIKVVMNLFEYLYEFIVLLIL